MFDILSSSLSKDAFTFKRETTKHMRDAVWIITLALSEAGNTKQFQVKSKDFLGSLSYTVKLRLINSHMSYNTRTHLDDEANILKYN